MHGLVMVTIQGTTHGGMAMRQMMMLMMMMMIFLMMMMMMMMVVVVVVVQHGTHTMVTGLKIGNGRKLKMSL